MRKVNGQSSDQAMPSGQTVWKGSDGQIPVVLQTLKHLIRGKGLHNRDIAEALGVTGRTITRWMAGKGLDIEALQALCGLVDISLVDLFDIAGATVDRGPVKLARKVEQALVDNPIMALLFMNLLHDFPIEELKKQLGLSEADTVLALVGLEKLGLIDLLPGNRIRLRAPKDVRWHKNGPVHRAAAITFGKIFGTLDFADPDLISEVIFLHLSSRSIVYLEDKFESLMKEITHLADSDRRYVDENQRHWYGLVVAARPIKRSPYALWRRGTDTEAPGDATAQS